MKNAIHVIILLVLLIPGRLVAQQELKAHRTFGLDCMQCHTTADWKTLKKDIEFDHRLTGYTLRGNHASASCAGCHAETAFSQLKTDCVACHEDQHRGEFGERCSDCHTPSGWRSPNEDVSRHQLTRFPLLGAHALADCQQCHVNQEEREYVNTPTECYACHQQDYEQAKEPDHIAGDFSRDCAQCHDMGDGGWKGAFEHPVIPFMQTAAHVNLECSDCHVSGYAGTPRDCFGCHEADYRAVQQPNHVAGGYDRDCTVCHEPVHWSPATFDHNLTAFPLQGAHAATPCTSCHESGFGKLPTDCWSCHEQDYRAVAFPNHVDGQFSQDCMVCHNVNAWSPADFDHSLTNFRLTGAHVRTACQSCHVGGQYSGLPLDCQGCHDEDYNRTSQPDHALVGFDRQCEECHNTEAWQPIERMPISIDHDKTRFPLLGAHRTTDCVECHAGLVFAGTPVECFACHEKDFNDAKNPDHVAGSFDRECTTCHNMDAWKPADFDHARTAFPLEGAHAAEPCVSCHVNGDYNITYVDCWQCHETDYNASTQPNHVSAQFAHECTTCHNTTAWVPSTFDHAQTNFPLTGAHASQACESCHIGGDYNITYTDCWQCHETDYNATTQPNHMSAQFAHECTTCHSTTSWVPSTFDHAQTNFPLTGAHATQACESCHIGGDYNITYTDCWQCHETDYNATTQPNHVSAQFAHECTTCHSTTSWVPSTFDHAQTNFPLTGAHATQACESCHIGGDYNITYTDCWQCHETDYNATTQPNHVSAQFAHECTTCHSTTSWVPSTFDHAQTNFPLTGAHATQACESCHIGGDYNITYTDCWQCHETDYNATTQPNHVSAQFAHDCTTCHTTTSWVPSTFDHAQTNFPLTGAHATQACESCHIGGDYNITYTDCWQCHETDFNNTTQPNHVSAQFAHDCTTCHTTTTWVPSSFNHAQTNFPLTGAHASQACESCHIGGDYSITYTDCFQCHETDFNNTTQPNHVSAQFAHDCTTCHSTTSWVPSSFNHAQTNFPLTGAHATQACESCHIGGDYSITYTDCFQCHESDFNATTQPNHVSAQFAHDCSTCHTTTAWVPSSFDHGQTQFPLTGAHATQACESCHIGGDYSITYTDCFQCHESDYNATQNPNHAAGQFSKDCTTCHSQTAWTPSNFDHAQTNFPLQGAHAAEPCQSCHVGGNYNITYTDCFQCHAADYNATQNPDHAAGQFSQDCTTCHSQTAWTPATFDHAQTNFPLQGAHAAQPCQSCHIGGNYTITYADCFQCHETDYNATQNPDHAAGQFSQDCTTCHSQTAWTPSSFDHAQTNFPLQGAHAAEPCQSCHIGGNYNITYTDCWQCHESDYNSSVNPAHASNQFPHDCSTCHDMNAWAPSSFDHAATAFPLTGAHQARPCIDCHTGGNYALTYTDCYQCHQTDYQNTSNPPHASNQFPQDCTTCHTTTAWQPSTFDHANTAFPITGAHTSATCLDCHVGGNFNITYTDCYQCHQSDYNQATSPANHQAMNLNHDCTVCHTQSAWEPASIFRTAHNVNAPTGFPIYGSVKHKYQDEWNNCSECHTTNVTSTYCCTSCHEHSNKNELDNEHQGVSGYSFSNCVSCANSGCHPNGREP